MSDEVLSYDPYALPPDDVLEPPATLWAALRKIGPGIILAGTIVGSGELILTTSLGAKHGFVFLWLILFSCVIKVFVQIELGRYAISSGKPTLGAFNDLPGRGSRAHPLVWWWFAMMLCSVFQIGGMISGVGQALNLGFPTVAAQTADGLQGIVPGFADTIRRRPDVLWSLVVCLATIALIYRGSYRRIEWLTTFIVVSVTLITVTGATALGFTGYPVHGSDLAEGLQFQIPPAGLAAAFAVFGITGVGATELFYYPYWCLEKGYARYVGKSDDSRDWERRAKGWIRVMHLDAWVSMVVFTISTVAFYLMGAAVLHPQGLAPANDQMIATLSEMYVGPFGEWTRTLFLIGAGAVLFKTVYLASAANSRLVTDFLGLNGFVDLSTAEKRATIISRFCLFLPVLATTFFIVARNPTFMVTVGGIAQGATLPMIALVALYLRWAKVDRRLQPWVITDLLLIIAVVSILVVAGYAVPVQILDLVKTVAKSG
jgi:manganese transport protein